MTIFQFFDSLHCFRNYFIYKRYFMNSVLSSIEKITQLKETDSFNKFDNGKKFE